MLRLFGVEKESDFKMKSRGNEEQTRKTEIGKDEDKENRYSSFQAHYLVGIRYGDAT